LVIKQGRESQLKNIAQEFINKVEDIKGLKYLLQALLISEQNIQKLLLIPKW
jgi:F-type H+-transporting ATPase subunit delta